MAETDFDQATGRLVLRCDAETFEQLQEVICREAGVFVPISVPVTPVREVAIVLAADVPPPRVKLVAACSRCGDLHPHPHRTLRALRDRLLVAQIGRTGRCT